MKINKKILKISALILAILMILSVCLFANSLVGNPLSKALAKNTAQRHLEEVYGGKDLKLDGVSYSFKDGYYHAYVTSESSVDTHFSLVINGFGVLVDDYYDNNVTNGWNTAYRLRNDYRKAVDTIIDSAAFPYSVVLGYGDLEFISREDIDIPEVKDYALITNELTLDGYYNVNELGAKAGKLTLYIDDKTVTAERMAEILLGVRKCFDDAGVGFYAIDCVLEYPQTQDSEYKYGRIEVIKFLYSDIKKSGLTERVEAADRAANEYYATEDAEKLNGNGEIAE